MSTGATPPAKRRKIDFIEAIVVLVGEAENRFVVHQNVLCTSSNFFRKAIEGSWKEGEEKQVRLKEAEVSSFEIYIAWLYTGTLEICGEDKVEGCTRNSKYYKCVGEAAQMGDFLEDRNFSNALVDELLSVMRPGGRVPQPPLIQTAYDMLPHKCGLCRLLVDFYSCYAKGAWFEHHADQIPTEFMTDIAMAAIRERQMALRDRFPMNRERCFYHEHKDDTDKCT
ncbi:hypothetical protein LTR08_009075 [Meristemomyces frigidus]|nr:hypothetical protein LTR08_009075 [Meristemomyces frigidus]